MASTRADALSSNCALAAAMSACLLPSAGSVLAASGQRQVGRPTRPASAPQVLANCGFIVAAYGRNVQCLEASVRIAVGVVVAIAFALAAQPAHAPGGGQTGRLLHLFGEAPASLSSFFPIAVDFQPPPALFSTWKSRGINTVIRVQ